MRNRTGIQAAHPGPARSCPPPAAHSQHDERHDLDAYIARLVDAAPTLSSQQRDTLALLLRRPRRR
jgi:hypothetical protein